MKKTFLPVMLLLLSFYFTSCTNAKSQDKQPSNAAYKIVNSYNLDDLVRTVNTQMEYGWKPCGGVAYGAEKYYQAMSK